MRYELFISLRYLRAKRREAFVSLITLISIVGVTISVMTLDTVLSVFTGFENDLRDRILGLTPHVVVTSSGGAVRDAAKLVQTISRVRGVVAAAPFLNGQAMVSHDSLLAAVQLRGVAPGRAGDVVDIRRFLREGSFAELGKRHQVPVGAVGDSKSEPTMALAGVVIGEELRRQLDVKRGDVMTIFVSVGSPSAVGMIPRVRRFVVVGVYDSGMFEFDSALVLVSLEDAQQLLGMEGLVSGIAVRTARLDRAADIAAKINEEAFGFPIVARDWMQMNRNLFVAFRFVKIVYFLVLTLMLVVAGFAILATLIMIVMEKRKDIAILKSIGATDRSIARIFVLKGLVIGVVGAVVGNTGGFLLSWSLSKLELPLPEGLMPTPTVPVEIVPGYFVAVTAAALLICFLVTLYPASRAARVVPVDVIRYE